MRKTTRKKILLQEKTFYYKELILNSNYLISPRNLAVHQACLVFLFFSPGLTNCSVDNQACSDGISITTFSVRTFYHC